VPKRGYLFALPVDGEKQGEPIVAAPRDQASGLLSDPSIAVLPLANLSGDPSQEYLSDGLTEDIINGLSTFSNLSVIARSSSFSYKGRAIDVREVGRQLGVRYVVEGSVRRVGNRIRITTQLVDAQSPGGWVACLREFASRRLWRDLLDEPDGRRPAHDAPVADLRQDDDLSAHGDGNGRDRTAGS
jgi:TolB-like protein